MRTMPPAWHILRKSVFYREVRVKQYDSMLTRTLVSARGQLIKIVTELSNQIRGLMKTSGWSCPRAPVAYSRPMSKT
jgi:transposase